MRPLSSALLGLCLLSHPTVWADESAAPASTPSAHAEMPERPPLPERSSNEAQALEQRLEQREQQVLQAGEERFLALWRAANVGEPQGAVILLPGDGESADDGRSVGPLRRKLPDAGWHSLSLSLPDPNGDAPPARRPDAISMPESAADTAPPPSADTSAADDESLRGAHAARVIARIEAAIDFARQQQAGTVVLLGHGTGAYWAARFLAEREQADVHNLLLVAAALPAGFSPTLDELVPQLELATGDFYYRDQAGAQQAARQRLHASKRLGHRTYVQVAMTALPGNPAVEQEQLYRRLRGWLSLNLRASAPSG